MFDFLAVADIDPRSVDRAQRTVVVVAVDEQQLLQLEIVNYVTMIATQFKIVYKQITLLAATNVNNRIFFVFEMKRFLFKIFFCFFVKRRC